jgi:purine-binding chemotaxis protein CheW
MDFLEIRRKARERAAARSAAEAAARRPGAAEAGPKPAADPEPALLVAPPEPAAPGPDPSAQAAPPAASEVAPPAADRASPATLLGTAASVVAPADVVEGALAGSLDGAQGPFRTWRPGQGPLPVAPPAPYPGPAQPGRGAHAAPRPAGRPAPRAPPGDPLEEFFYRPDEDGPDLPDLGAGAAAETPRPSLPERVEEFLTFVLGTEEYALPIGGVREVIKAPPITEVPRAPPGILGVITVRGEVVVIFDPRRKLGLPASALPEGGRVIVVNAEHGASGIVVDSVEGVVRLPRGAIEARPHGLGGAGGEAMLAIGHHRDRIFTVLDLDTLVRRPAAAEGRALGDRP